MASAYCMRVCRAIFLSADHPQQTSYRCTPAPRTPEQLPGVSVQTRSWAFGLDGPTKWTFLADCSTWLPKVKFTATDNHAAIRRHTSLGPLTTCVLQLDISTGERDLRCVRSNKHIVRGFQKKKKRNERNRTLLQSTSNRIHTSNTTSCAKSPLSQLATPCL